jgi:hypothetical protein
MPCDENRTPTDRDEAGSISSLDQKVALLTSSIVREIPVPLFALTQIIQMSIRSSDTPAQRSIGKILEQKLASRVGGESVGAASGRFVKKRSGVRHASRRHAPGAHPTTSR